MVELVVVGVAVSGVTTKWGVLGGWGRFVEDGEVVFVGFGVVVAELLSIWVGVSLVCQVAEERVVAERREVKLVEGVVSMVVVFLFFVFMDWVPGFCVSP